MGAIEESINYIIGPLGHIFNLSITTGIVPDESSATGSSATIFAEFLVAIAADQLIDQLMAGKMTSSRSKKTNKNRVGREEKVVRLVRLSP